MAKEPKPTVLAFPENGAADLSGIADQVRTSKAQRQEFYLPVNGFIWFYPEEVRVIDHPAFQRLSKINQLGQAHYVFRGATHKRIEHVLGAVGVSQRMISAVNYNADKAALEQGHLPPAEQDWRAGLNDCEERFVRLGALLHDIGHLAAGHTLEDELGLFGKHDEDDRLDFIFGDTDLGQPSWDTGFHVPTLAEVVDEAFRGYRPRDLQGRLSASRIIRLLIRKPPKQPTPPRQSKPDRYANDFALLAQSADLRAAVCTNMIGNTICADLLDYIVRDWYHIGKVVPPEDRIFQYMEIRNPNRVPPDVQKKRRERRDASDKFVIALGSNAGDAPKIRTDGVSAILGLLERRYELGETVLYHKTKLSAGAMLGRALHELWEGEDHSRDLLHLGDEQLIEFALYRARAASVTSTEGLEGAALAAAERKVNQGAVAAYILLRLRARRLFKAFYTERHWTLTSAEKRRLINLFTPDDDNEGCGAANRTYAARLLEDNFGLDAGSIVVSCVNVKPKIAQVEVRVNNEISKFNDYEETEEKGLSGGHLKAQEKRFGDLWRLDFFLEPEQYEKLKRESRVELDLMKAAIRQIFVRPALDRSQIEQDAQRIIDQLTRLKTVAARSDAAKGTGAATEVRRRRPGPSLADLWTRVRE